jgi:hypothetical protein
MMTGPTPDAATGEWCSHLDRVAALMRARNDGFTTALAAALADVADEHRQDLCAFCIARPLVPEPLGECPALSLADRLAFAWLLSELEG